ncbi:C45 family autoproteolytic acyltransferase/hydolase [Aquisphaera insulae]|uniref:C45 family autoproteolytic acyltransferase/hydolase n=1 Tax=Aquisphaera insulae TaxID=2712864 RepID=UPI0013EB02A4|nr:C45 family autoproteolytic acyltransferase/hydolase [Aquisphaera insulae]
MAKLSRTIVVFSGWLTTFAAVAANEPAPSPAPGANTTPSPVKLAAGAREFRPDPAGVQRYGPGYRYPQAGFVVVHVEGEPYDRGYQHGRLLAPEIVKLIDGLAEYRSRTDPAGGWRDLRFMADALFLRGIGAEYIEEMKGIADGAAAAGAKFQGRPLDLLDIATVNADIETTFLDDALDATATGLEGKRFREPAEGTTRKAPESHCSAFAATGPATADGKVVFGHITMWNLVHAIHYKVWLDITPARGHRVVMQTYPGGLMSGLDYYMNDAGLVACETTIGQTKFDPKGIPLVDRIRRAVQYADSIDGAVKILGEGNNGLYSNEWLLADTKTNEIAMFELGTHKSKLWRSSKGEWFGGTPGFYWGCNNAKDLQVRLETEPSLEGRPADPVFHPHDRDRTWLKLFDANRTRIDESFGFLAFTTPPLAAARSLDAKFTTTDLAREMTSWARFASPMGRLWEPTDAQRRLYPDVPPLVPNDWTLIRVADPKPAATSPGPVPAAAVDLARGSGGRGDRPDISGRDHTPAWHGTILPEGDADLWLASAFSGYERIVALELAYRKQAAEGGKATDPDDEAREAIGLALFGPISSYLTAVVRRGGDIPLAAIHPDLRSDEWYDIAAGKGVLVLAALRKAMGDETFLPFMDEFGRGHAGRPVTTAEFFAAAEKAKGSPFGRAKDLWLGGGGMGLDFDEALRSLGGAAYDHWRLNQFWPVGGFERQLDATLIVYGTLAESDAQREAASLLQKKLAARWANILVPIRSDAEITEEELAANHLLLIGRPATNKVAARLAASHALLPVRFGPASVHLGNRTFANPRTAVAAACVNPLAKAKARSVVVFAGLSAEGTYLGISRIVNSGGFAAPSLVSEADAPVVPVYLPLDLAPPPMIGD